MKFAEITRIFKRRTKTSEGNGKFADFFLNAQPEKKREVISEAARGANKDQQKILLRSRS